MDHCVQLNLSQCMWQRTWFRIWHGELVTKGIVSWLKKCFHVDAIWLTDVSLQLIQLASFHVFCSLWGAKEGKNNNKKPKATHNDLVIVSVFLLHCPQKKETFRMSRQNQGIHESHFLSPPTNVWFAIKMTMQCNVPSCLFVHTFTNMQNPLDDTSVSFHCGSHHCFDFSFLFLLSATISFNNKSWMLPASAI